MFNKVNLLDVPLLKKRFSATALTDYPDQEVYSNLPKDTEGQLQPVIVGCPGIADTGIAYQNFLLSIPTVIVDRGTDMGSGTYRASKFKICAKVTNPETGNVHGLTGSNMYIYKYSAGVVTLLTVTTNYTLADSNTEIDMVNSAAGDLLEQDQIRVRCSNGFDTAGTEYSDDGSNTFTGNTASGHYIYQFPDVIHFLLVCFANIKTAQMDLATFTLVGIVKQGVNGTFKTPLPWAYTASNSFLAAYFDSQISIRELIDVLAFSMDCILVQGNDGLLRLQPYSQTTANTDKILTSSGISGFTETKTLDALSNRVVVKCAQIPAGDQNLEFTIPLKKRKRKRKVLKWQTITIETQRFAVKLNALTRTIGGVSVVDDLGNAVGVQNQIEVVTYFADQNMGQDFANELYRRWGRSFWRAAFTDADGELNTSLPSEKIIVYRSRSGSGDISNGKAYKFLDGTRKHSNNVVEILRADEVI